MKSDEVVSQRDWTCDREGGRSENEGETDMPHVKEETVSGLKKDKMTTKISLGAERQSLKVVKK